MSLSKPNRVYVFGDQTFNYEHSLAQLLRCHNVFLDSFFRKCYSAIRTELGRLPLHTRDVDAKFSSVADLLMRKRDGCLGPALELVLCLVHTLAAFIWQHSEGQLSFPTPQDSMLLGFCTGSFAAAAVSSSRDLVSFIPAAVHAVVVALYTGLRAAREAQSIHGNVSSRWSLFVLGVSGDHMTSLLESFNSRNSFPPSCHAYISAFGTAGMTISGPPDVLTRLSQEDCLGKFDKSFLPIRSPYHASHLFFHCDIDAILQAAHAWAPTDNIMPFIPIMSCGTGHFAWVDNSQALLESSIHDVLTLPIFVEKAIDRVGLALKARPPADVLVVPIGADSVETVHRRLKMSLGRCMPGVIKVAAQSVSAPERSATDRPKIAVIGMSGRFPGASSPEDLWSLLQSKVDMCREVPPTRWNVETHVDMSGKRKNTSKVRWGCWLQNPDLFDASFFCISPREAPQVDPAQRLALMTAYEAIEHAGVVPGRTPSTQENRVGVFYGVTSNDWCESNSGQDIDAYYIPGANRAFIPGRINYFFKFSGPSYAVDTACSSSLAAIHVACNSLWQGDIDMAIAGGTNVLTNPDMTAGLDKGHFLSPTGSCKTFDESADGYCRGEGVATIVLKRLEDALEDGDTVYGLIAAAYTNHSAEAESITRPHVGAQKDVLKRVINDSASHPYDIGYVEMHGTGTQAGDTREMNSVCDVLAPVDKPHKRPFDQPLHLGALKSNIGHGESASGVSALIKVMMMMRKGQFPPHCGIKTCINPAFPKDLTQRNVYIDFETTSWLRFRDMPRKAVINNFSAAGGNTSILVEEAMNPTPSTTAKHCNTRPTYPVALSAKCAKSLKSNIQSLIAHLSNSAVALPELSYTTTARRIAHQHRVIVASNSIAGIKSQLADALDSDAGSKRVIPPRQILFAFTGQGSQYPGMGKQLLESLDAFREQIIRFDQLAQRLGFFEILPLFHASGGDDISNYPPIVVQLANTCMQIALARIWISWGIAPTAVVGHSLGEYAALNIAGVLSDSDTIFLVGRRAMHLQKRCEESTHTMLAVMASVTEIESILHGVSFEIACINGPKETVLAGTAAQVAELQQTLTSTGVRNTLIQVPYAFHSSHIMPIEAPFTMDAQKVVFRKPQIPVLSPLHGTVVQQGELFYPEYIVRHAREPVQMMKCLQSAFSAGILTNSSFAIEFGPHPVVSGMIKATLGSHITVLPTLRRNNEPWEILTKSLSSLYAAGSPIRWDGYFADIPLARKVIELPAYNWDLKSFWIPYRNDWTLTKGDLPTHQCGVAAEVEKSQSSTTCSQNAPFSIVDTPKLESSTIHEVLKETITSDGYEIVTECNVNRADVRPFIRGHTVDGFSLCTPAVYADIGFSIAAYALERFQPAFPERLITIVDMDVTRALIGSANWKQFLRCTAKINWASKGAKLRITVHDDRGSEIGQLSTFSVKFIDKAYGCNVQNKLPNMAEHLERMRLQLAEGKTCKFSGPMAYRLVSALAEFNPDYYCVDEVLYDNESYECIQTVSFGQMKKGGVFYINPGIIDGLTQSGGFTMNANDKTKLDTDVFVNHGWKSLQLFEAVRDDCQYLSHVRMTPRDEGLWEGDVTIFTDDRIVGLVKGVQIQKVPRRLLKFILTQAAKPPKSETKSTKETESVNYPMQGGVLATTSATPLAVKAAPALAPIAAASATTQCLEGSACDNSLISKALGIVAEQSGISVSDLRDETCFNDIGIDSILSMMITSLFTEELGITADSTLFLKNGTVAELKRTLGRSNSSSTPLKSQGFTELGDSTCPSQDTTTEVSHKEALTVHQAQPVLFTAASQQGSLNIQQQLADVLRIISEEADVPVEQLTDDTLFADLGVDSLLSLMIGSRLRDELDMDIDTQSMLTTLDSIHALRIALFPTFPTSNTTRSGSSQLDSGYSTPPSTEAQDVLTPSSEADFTPVQTEADFIPVQKSVPTTTSFVLQGNPRTASKVLWFFPDGSGLASSYAGLPRISNDLVVYGLNSPYLKKGLEMNCSWDGLVGSFLTEIQRRQPSGPYSFAGWSAGGILGFRASQILMNAGEVVRDLIIIDSPPPFKLKHLPEHFFEFFSVSGMFGGQGTAPEWVISHFRSINRVLSTYSATPLTVSTLRKVNILWACESCTDERFKPQLDDPKDMEFLTVKRTDFTAGKWGPLFPGVPLQIDRAEGEHHWSLLRGESAAKTSTYIGRVLK
ncbi:t1pks [Metarhizium rileyi]|uniref:T1pks n=1 Tax=Metarhizium rileyi (strain RCEF 4871) TaxID=1649241 RepID=A0A5C6FZG5_METRR|nr:t1pks [Metarhizium rileyi]